MGAAPALYKRIVPLGLGQAVLRLVRLESLRTLGVATPADLAERDLILQGLDRTYEFRLHFDCDDEAPDTIEIFRQSAETSCCRILKGDTSRRKKPAEASTLAVVESDVEESPEPQPEPQPEPEAPPASEEAPEGLLSRLTGRKRDSSRKKK